MLWQEDDAEPKQNRLDEVVDLLFSLECRELPVDHIHSLSKALQQALPELTEDPRFAIHEIHLAGSQNGWERPDPEKGQNLILSRRTKMTLRVPSDRAGDVIGQLQGAELDINGYPLKVGKAKQRKLSSLCTIFARHIVLQPGEENDEELLLNRLVTELQEKDIQVRKALCGITQQFDTPEGPIYTRSILFADLNPDESIALQCDGLGEHRLLGCGIFVPHKGIEAVNKQQKD
ncbi:MAG: type I-MYXAN CRISPR-associated protein Cas6/Cmx6 [bacterium]